jgi:ferredoxin
MASDLASFILRTSLGALGCRGPSCSSCRRTPVAGELMHVFESGKSLCTLCVGRLPEGERAPLRSERIHAAERPLDVVPRAA